MTRKITFLLSSTVAISSLIFVPSVMAVSVTIAGYNIVDANLSGFGGTWGHTYTGLITETAGGLGDYSGGTGTMANGIIENDESGTQLFATLDSLSDPASAIITVFLDDFYSINTISIFQGDIFDNSIPGEIDGVDLTINGNTQTLLGAPFGSSNNAGTPVNDLFTVTDTPLDGLVSNQITFSMFFEGGCCNAYSIAEIEIDGNLAVPVPATFGLMGFGLAVLGFAARRRRHSGRSDNSQQSY